MTSIFWKKHSVARLLLTLCIPLVATVIHRATTSVLADQTAAKAEPAAKTDLYGDALPTGAVARMGSIRFRFGDVKNVNFTSDSKTIITNDLYSIRVTSQ